MGGAKLAVATSRAIGSLCVRDGATLAVSMHVHDDFGFRPLHRDGDSGATTREPWTLLPDLWKTVIGTSAQLFSRQCAVWHSEMMQAVARYMEDRSVHVRHAAVETMSCAAETGARNAIKLVSKFFGRWFGVSRGDKKRTESLRHGTHVCSAAAPAGEYTISVESLS